MHSRTPWKGTPLSRPVLKSELMGACRGQINSLSELMRRGTPPSTHFSSTTSWPCHGLAVQFRSIWAAICPWWYLRSHGLLQNWKCHLSGDFSLWVLLCVWGAPYFLCFCWSSPVLSYYHATRFSGYCGFLHRVCRTLRSRGTYALLAF